MAKNTFTVGDSAYIAPSCIISEIIITQDLLEASFTGNDIDDATVDDWGTL